MNVNRRRLWLLVLVAVGVVTGVLGFVVFREDSKDDLSTDDVPRLVVVNTDQTNGQRVVTFRLEVPKNKDVMIAEARMEGVEVVSVIPPVNAINWTKTLPSTNKSEVRVVRVVTTVRSSYKSRVVTLLPTPLEEDQKAEWGTHGDPTRVWIRAGTSREFSVVAPHEFSWHLSLETLERPTGLGAWKARLRMVWLSKSLSRWTVPPPPLYRQLASELTTNSVPPTVDAPRP